MKVISLSTIYFPPFWCGEHYWKQAIIIRAMMREKERKCFPVTPGEDTVISSEAYQLTCFMKGLRRRINVPLVQSFCHTRTTIRVANVLNIYTFVVEKLFQLQLNRMLSLGVIGELQCLGSLAPKGQMHHKFIFE